MNTLGANNNAAENPIDISPSDLDLQPSDEERLSHIAESAYCKAVARGSSPGYELDGWLAAKARGR